MPRCSLHVLSRGGPRVDPGHPGAVTHFCVATSGILLGTTGREPTSTFCTVWCVFSSHAQNIQILFRQCIFLS